MSVQMQPNPALAKGIGGKQVPRIAALARDDKTGHPRIVPPCPKKGPVGHQGKIDHPGSLEWGVLDEHRV